MAAAWWNVARLTEQGRSLENLADIFPVLVSTAEKDCKKNGSGRRLVRPRDHVIVRLLLRCHIATNEIFLTVGSQDH